eukprot:1351792-Rhodomonas_salina.1
MGDRGERGFREHCREGEEGVQPWRKGERSREERGEGSAAVEKRRGREELWRIGEWRDSEGRGGEE